MAKQKESLLVRLSMLFFRNWRFSILLWVFLLGFGAITYNSLIKREGFPPIQFPLTVVNGTYFVDNASKVDQDVLVPLNKSLENVEGVQSVQATARPNFFTFVVFFGGDVQPNEGTDLVKQAFLSAQVPETVTETFTTVDPAGFLNEYDMLLSVYSTEQTTPEMLDQVSGYVASEFAKDSRFLQVEALPLVESGVDPRTGAQIQRQTSFGRIGVSEGEQLVFYDATTIGIDRQAEELDIIELSEAVQDKIATLNLEQFGDGYEVAIGAEFASSIETQISSLEENLIGGLIAVALVSCLFITWRASVITGLLMVTVLAVTIAVMYLIGYTLNTITLFALVLALGLFVDDSTIVVESITANHDGKRPPGEVIRRAIKMIGLASFAGSMTTVLAFVPLAFVSGILGEFIRLLPITVIISLVVSIFLSLTIIPVLSRFIILRGNPKKPDWFTRMDPVSKLIDWLGQRAGALPMLLKTNKKKGRLVAVSAVLLSFAFVVGSGYFATRLSFNIFPPTKDSDNLGYQISFPPQYTLEQAQASSRVVDEIVAREIGQYVVKGLYGGSTLATERGADVRLELVSFTEREPKSPELIEKLETAFEQEQALPEGVSLRVLQFDAGPPVSEYPFAVQIRDEDVDRGLRLAGELEAHLTGATITKFNGDTAQITRVKPADALTITRVDGARTFEVRAAFSDNDTSALLEGAETFVKEKFTEAYLAEQGFPTDALDFDYGQESENADSFASLAYVFPIVLVAMYVLLAVQFKSFAQPLLIFMAIPFSLFGVFAGLYFTDNALSFFVQVGLIGLIGIAVNNSILLTDYANQERRAGSSPIQAISDATARRFRPLVTTTLTTVAALVPLALSDPFWEALSFTIIFGLLSSTFLIIVAFPYYYLAVEWLRHKTRCKKIKKTA